MKVPDLAKRFQLSDPLDHVEQRDLTADELIQPDGSLTLIVQVDGRLVVVSRLIPPRRSTSEAGARIRVAHLVIPSESEGPPTDPLRKEHTVSSSRKVRAR